MSRSGADDQVWTSDCRPTEETAVAAVTALASGRGYRCSTKRQGQSGLGLEAQRAAVAAFVGDGTLLMEFQEVESGTRADRPALDEALRECRMLGAVLVIA